MHAFTNDTPPEGPGGAIDQDDPMTLAPPAFRPPFHAAPAATRPFPRPAPVQTSLDDTPDAPTPDAFEVNGLLRTQIEAYRRLLRLAGAQHECVEANETERLLEILQNRQRELERITVLEQRLRPIKRRWAEVAATWPMSERDEAEKMFGETKSLLAEITASDHTDALVLQQRKLNLGRQAAAAGAGRVVNRQYTAAYTVGTPRLNVSR